VASNTRVREVEEAAYQMGVARRDPAHTDAIT
jgi:hypothetical protein